MLKHLFRSLPNSPFARRRHLLSLSLSLSPNPFVRLFTCLQAWLNRSFIARFVVHTFVVDYRARNLVLNPSTSLHTLVIYYMRSIHIGEKRGQPRRGRYENGMDDWTRVSQTDNCKRARERCQRMRSKIRIAQKVKVNRWCLVEIILVHLWCQLSESQRCRRTEMPKPPSTSSRASVVNATAAHSERKLWSFHGSLSHTHMNNSRQIR